jgi:arylsulfatase A-like enzyme
MNNYVLLVCDCGRYDKFSNRNAAFFINALGDAGWRFNNAISPYNQTKSSMASMFSGLLPSEHLVQSHRDDRIDIEKPLLAEVMKKKGYNTIGLSTMYWMHPMIGWGRGFDYYNNVANLDDDANVPASSAFDFVKDKLNPPFFLYLHLCETHTPYNYPKALKGEFDDYDASLKFLDMQVRYIYDNLPKDTTIIITADHGVGLGEYNNSAWGQGPNSWLYDCVIHVPLFVYHDSIESMEIDEMFNTKDIFGLITEDVLNIDKFAISESYAYHHESCIHKNLNDVGRERAMKGYRCILDKELKLIEGEDGDLHFFNRYDEGVKIPWHEDIGSTMLEELRNRSKMNLKAKRIDIIQNKLNKKLGGVHV